MRLPDNVQKNWNKMDDAGIKMFLCGGAVRDMILLRPIKDYDFFLHCDRDTFLEKCTTLGINVKLKTGAEGMFENYDTAGTLDYVYEDEENKTQYMLLNTKFSPDIIDAFGVSISKCYYDGFGYYISEDMFDSLESRIITYYKEHLENPKYLNKIKSYFPDWKFECEDRTFQVWMNYFTFVHG